MDATKELCSYNDTKPNSFLNFRILQIAKFLTFKIVKQYELHFLMYMPPNATKF